jgi:glyoxylase-like metal-dependent hydrolase (beta-lactamase superfamily II)
MAHYYDAGIMKYGIGFHNGMCLTPGIKNWLIYQLVLKHSGIDIEPVTADEILSDNDILPVLGGIRIIHTPGHSKGHISLLAMNEGVLMAGDLLSNTTSLGLSVIYEDLNDGLSSIRKAAGHDFEKMVFDHGRAIMKNATKKIRAAFTNYGYSLVQSF